MPSSKERSQPSPDGFDFTERERLFYRVSHDRFNAIFKDERTTIHKITLSQNSYGEFLFVTLSREGEQGREPVTMYGLGFHEYRERWIHQEWYWFQANAFPSTMAQAIPLGEAGEVLRQREEEVAGWVTEDTQTKRGRLFEMLAELSDDDAAMTEMDDLGGALDQLFDEME